MTRSSPHPVRVGLVIGQLTTGGAEGQLLELVQRLDPRFAANVYALSEGTTTVRAALERRGVPVRIIGGRGPARVRRLRAALMADGVAIAHAWLFIANAYVAAASLPRAPWQLVTSARNCKVQGLTSRVANAIAFRLSRRIVVNSADVADYITSTYGAPRERIRVVVNGVDTDRFFPAASLPRNPPHVVTIGRLVVQKNHAMFLRAAAELGRREPEARFTIVGEGPLRAELERLAAELGIRARVTFTGERRDVEDLLRTATVFWLTSGWEGMPNVVLEALATGVPVVTTAVSGVRELLGGCEGGAIVGIDDAGGFVGATAAWLGDPDALQRAGKAARTRALEFSPQRMAARLAALYDEILPPPDAEA